MPAILLEDFGRKGVWYRAHVENDGTLSNVETIRASEQHNAAIGLGFRARFLSIAGQFVALYRLPPNSQPGAADYMDAGYRYLCIGSQVFDLAAESTITTFRKGFLFRSFSIAYGDHQFRLKYWPPFHWTTFDGEL